MRVRGPALFLTAGMLLLAVAGATGAAHRAAPDTAGPVHSYVRR